MSRNQYKVSTMVNEINLDGVLSSLMDSYIIILDTDTTVLYLNKDINDYKFLDKSIQIGCSFLEAIAAPKQEMLKVLLSGLLETGKPFRSNVSKIENGVMVHYEIRYSPVFREDGGIVNVLIEARDVSEEKIFDNKIKRVAGDFTRLVEHANAVIIGTDSQGYITDWNDKSTEVTGYAKNETFARKFTELIASGMHHKFDSVFNQLLNGESLSNYELPFKDKEGNERILLFNATPRKNNSDQVDGILFIGQDITELIASRKSLEKKVAERTLDLHKSNLEIQQQKDQIEKEQEKSDNLLRSILPDFVASEIKEKGHVVPRYFDSATILFADLAGFTTLCKGMTPEEIVYELNYIFVGFDFIIEKNGLEKIKTIGDGYMAVGGLPIKNNSHATDAVKAGLEMVAFVNRVNQDNKITDRPPWQVRVGINTGELTAGVIGRNKFAYDVWGGAVNTASRMESTSEVGKVNISSTTYELVKNEFDCIHRGSIAMKNMGEIQMYYVQGIKE